MRRHLPRLIVGFALAFVAWLLVHGFDHPAEGLVMFTPGLLALLPLLAGRYLGERAIERARAARGRATVPVAPHRVVAAARPRPTLALIPRGSLLLASSLAKRPPPALS